MFIFVLIILSIIISLVETKTPTFISLQYKVSKNEKQQQNSSSKTTKSKSVCLDTVPLDTCLFGTKFIHKPKQKFISAFIFPHVPTSRSSTCAFAAAGMRRISSSSTSFSSSPFLSVKIPIGFPFSLRSFRPHQTKTSFYLENRNFFRGYDSNSLFGNFKTDEDFLLVQNCETITTTTDDDNNNKNVRCSVDVTIPRRGIFFDDNNDSTPKSSSKRKKKIEVFYPNALFSTTNTRNNKDFEEIEERIEFTSIGEDSFCIGLFGKIFEEDLIGKELFSNQNCISDSSTSSTSTSIFHQLAPISQPHYTTVFQGGRTHVVEGYFKILNNNNNNNDVDGVDVDSNSKQITTSTSSSSCHQASFLSSLYCRSCSSSSIIGQEKENVFVGACPHHLIESKNSKYRSLDYYELDSTCRKATCVEFRVFDDIATCQNKDPEKKGKLLRMQCGSVADRDTTGDLLHNVFLQCDEQIANLKLYGECDERWCKAEIKVRDQIGGDDNNENKCILAEAGLLSKTEAKYLRLEESGKNCETFGISVYSRKPKQNKNKNKVVSSSNQQQYFLDTDRFPSDSCIPGKLGAESAFQPICVSSSSTTNDNNNNFWNSLKIHFFVKEKIEFKEQLLERLGEHSSSSCLNFEWKGNISSSLSPQLLVPVDVKSITSQQQQQQQPNYKARAHEIAVSARRKIFSQGLYHVVVSCSLRQQKKSKMNNELLHLLSLSDSQLNILGVVTFHLENIFSPSSSSEKSGEEKEEEELKFVSNDNNVHNNNNQFILPRSFRNFIADYSDVKLGNIPTRAAEKSHFKFSKKESKSGNVENKNIVLVTPENYKPKKKSLSSSSKSKQQHHQHHQEPQEDLEKANDLLTTWAYSVVVIIVVIVVVVFLVRRLKRTVKKF